MNKYYLQQAARLLSPPLYHSGIHHLTRPWYGGLGHILMFHRVLPPRGTPRIYNHLGLEISPAHLEATIGFFRKRDYDFLSLDDLAEEREPERRRRKFVVFTFDDGYADNYEFAYPVLKKHNVPFAIYVATGQPDGHAFLWWYMLEEIILRENALELELDGVPVRLPARTMAEKELAFIRVNRSLSAADKPAMERYKQSLFPRYLDDSPRITRELSLTWDQIGEMSRDPLVIIGAHTVNHYPLKSLSDAESRFEMAESKRILEARIQKEVRHICYPIGSYSDREVGLAAACGYRTATTVNMTNWFPGHASHPFAWPRIMINALTTEKLLTLQVNGLLPLILNKGRRFVA